MDNNSLAHTKWNCKCHIVFAYKYRRQAIYGKIKKDIGKILRNLYEYKGVEIIEANTLKIIYRCYKYTTKIKRIKFYGLLKGKKFVNGI